MSMSKDKQSEGSSRNVHDQSGKKDMEVDGDSVNGLWIGYQNSSAKKIRACKNLQCLDENHDRLSSDENRNVGSSVVVHETLQASDNSYYVPSLSDELVHHILPRVPRSEYWKLCEVSKGLLAQVKTGELYKIRRECRLMEPSVFMLASGEPRWWSFDQNFTSCMKLPVLPSDSCFAAGDKESLCAGTHLLVAGKEIEGVVIWRYELAVNKWYRGPSMISPRCLFASASCGNVACVAGGIGTTGRGNKLEVLNSVEQYNPESSSWEPLPKMHKKRKLCSGFYMDNKFYVIGGRDENGVDLTCGEIFDADRNTWELVPDMLKDVPVPTSRSPPLVAVVSNELYTLEASTNKLKVYLKKSNTWKDLGEVPVRADHSRGWGVAFKSLGNELLVIGGTCNSFAGHGMAICTCCPDPDAKDLNWRVLSTGRNRISHFILNCSVMVA